MQYLIEQLDVASDALMYKSIVADREDDYATEQFLIGLSRDASQLASDLRQLLSDEKEAS